MATKTAIVPYLFLTDQGDWNLPEAYLLSLYYGLLADGLGPLVFHDGRIFSGVEFVDYMQTPGRYVWIGMVGPQAVGYAIMEDLLDRRAYAHFAFRKEFAPLSLSFGRDWLCSILHRFPVDVLLGTIPSHNLGACMFAENVGFRRVGKVPNYIWDARRGKPVSATFFYATAETAREAM
ncbi:MAG TPA: hypothetical protein VNT26_14740 [Candidatus Sulfotelmatobacter sp.]|nr:hypothetical protein [Candidatus Sulfotelmatobacter sp.]